MNPLRRLLRESAAARRLASPALAARRRMRARRARVQGVVYDRLRALLVEDVVVRLESFGGDFALDGRSHLLQRLLLDGDYEPEALALLRGLVVPDRDVVDAGANAGFFSVALARALTRGRLVAIEPSGAMVRRLRANLERNGLGAHVLVEHAALSDSEGEVVLTGVPGNEEYGTIGTPSHPALQAEMTERNLAFQSETVRAVRLDDLVELHRLRPALVKIDVEGAEMQVIGGAEETLRRHRPVVLTELNDAVLRANGTSAQAVVDRVEALDYCVVAPFGGTYRPVDALHFETSDEVLCLPAEHALAQATTP